MQTETIACTSAASNVLNVRINGALLAVAKRPCLMEVDVPLRSVALSDSPVLIRSQRESDRVYVANRIHALGRRRELPLHVCRNADQARALLSGQDSSALQGTWALHGVASWAPAEQRLLAQLLSRVDEHRLHGRLAHHQIPRVVVIEGPDAHERMDPTLERRLSFFDIALS